MRLFEHDLFMSVRPMHLPVLNGIYFLYDLATHLYLGQSRNICRRLRSHNRRWERAICLSFDQSSLRTTDLEHIELVLGLVFLLSGRKTSNRRLDYPVGDEESLLKAKRFLQEAFIPIWEQYGWELGLPRCTHALVAQILRILSKRKD